MTRDPFEHLMAAAAEGVLTMRPARMRPGLPYKIDARDASAIVVLLNVELRPHERAEVWRLVDEDVRTILRQRRRADLVPVVELVDDALDQAEPTGTEGDDVEREALARRAILRTVT